MLPIVIILTIFDPSPSDRPAQLDIRICDSCVLKHRERISETGDHLPAALRDDVAKFFERRS
jgi:hypothetical protein